MEDNKQDPPLTYEQLRMEKLRRNQLVLATLGLEQLGAGLNSTPQAKPEKKRESSSERRKRILQQLEETPGPRRRSPRLSSDASKSLSETPSTEQAESEEEEVKREEEVQHPFDPSKVVLYTMMTETDNEVDDKQKSDGKTLKMIGNGASDPDLKRMYALGFHEDKPIMAAGGHQGRVSVFSSTFQKSHDEELLLSFKASRGWVSGVRFLSSMSCGLVVTSNDGELSLWDCSLARNMEPKKLFSQALHGKSGIFDLDLHKSNAFVTSSKDGSLCYGRVGQSNVEIIHRVAAHDGVAKTVMFQPDEDSSVMCSAGNDSTVKVWDIRQSRVKPQIEFHSSFNVVINVARWNPGDNKQILTASFATSMELFDIRHAKKPAVLFSGHIPANCSRASSIYQPVFMQSGTRIVASGGGSKNLTIFDTKTAKVVSSGFVGWEAGALETTGLSQNRLAVSHGCDVSFFQCM